MSVIKFWNKCPEKVAKCPYFEMFRIDLVLNSLMQLYSYLCSELEVEIDDLRRSNMKYSILL